MPDDQLFQDRTTGKYWRLQGNSYVPAEPPSAPAGAAKRFLTQSVGLPENVDTSLKGNIAALEEMNAHPGKALGRGAGQFFSGLNPWPGFNYNPFNLKPPEATQTAIQRFKQPGWPNKVAGAGEYALSAVPWAGSGAVRSEEQAMQGDIAGSAGSLLNTAWSTLALRAAPQLGRMAANTSVRPFMRRVYGIGEPAVGTAKQHINQQASEVANANELLERQQTGRQFLDEAAPNSADQIGDFVEQARKDVRQQFNKRWDALNTAIGPSTPVNFEPVEAARMQAEEFLNNPGLQRQLAGILKRAGFPDSLVGSEFIDTEGGLIPKPVGNVPYVGAQRIYTQLGEAAEKLSGPDAGQLYRAVRTIQHPLGESLGAAHDAAGSGPAYRQLKSDYTDFMENFNDPGAPIRQLIDADTPEARMRVLQKYNLNDKVAGILDKYGSPALGSQIRTLVRTMNELPNAPSGQPKPVPEWPGTVEWREQQLQEKLRRQSQSSSPGEMAPGTFRTRTAAARQLGVSLLNNPAFRNWLSGRSEQLKPYQPPPVSNAPTGPRAAPPPAATPPVTPPAGPSSTVPSVPPWAIGPLLKSLREQSQRQAFDDLVKRLGGSGKVGPL